MNNLQAEYNAKRKLNLDGQLTHKDLFDWLGEQIRLCPSDLPFTVEQIKASNDEHLNDLPLAKWDRCDPFIRSKAALAGMKSWSLSDTVCVLKAYARKIAD